jgi:hypothetical protein
MNDGVGGDRPRWQGFHDTWHLHCWGYTRMSVTVEAFASMKQWNHTHRWRQWAGIDEGCTRDDAA